MDVIKGQQRALQKLFFHLTGEPDSYFASSDASFPIARNTGADPSYQYNSSMQVGQSLAAALWLVDNAGLFLRTITDAQKCGILPTNADTLQIPHRIFDALKDVLALNEDHYIYLLSSLLLDMGISLRSNENEWRDRQRQKFVELAIEIAYLPANNSFVDDLLHWIVDVEFCLTSQSTEECEKSLRDIVRSASSSTDFIELTLNNWAYFLLLVNRSTATTAMAKIALEMAYVPRNLDTLSWDRYLNGLFDEAIELNEKALSLADAEADRNSYTEIMYHKCCIAVDAGAIELAEETYAEMVKKFPGEYWTGIAENIASIFNTNIDIEGERACAEFRYDVAISFAGEDREYAEELAEYLRKNNVQVFYDEFEKANLWGKNLFEYLSQVYEREAKFCVMLISRRYADKPWPNLERRAAQARAFVDETEYILPVRLDDSPVRGLLATVGFIEWRREGAKGVAEHLIQKIHEAASVRR